MLPYPRPRRLQPKGCGVANICCFFSSFSLLHVLWRGIKTPWKHSLTNCHRNSVVINEEWCKRQSLSAFEFKIYLEILFWMIKFKNPEHCGSPSSKTWLCRLGIWSCEVTLRLVAASDRITFIRELESLCVSVGTPKGKIRVSSELTGKFKTSLKDKRSKAEEIQGKKWNYS